MRGNVASTLAIVVGVASAATHNSTGTCAHGLYLIVAARVKGSTVVPLDYPAALANPEYDESVGDGVEVLQRAVQGYTRSCPDSKVAIMGYSQGAQVTTDALCGGTGAGFESAKPLSADLIEKNTIVLFGDPTHVVNTGYDRGTSVKNGVFERNNASVGACETYSDRMVSYCDTGDVYCDTGEDRKVHGSYIKRYGNDALEFIVDRYGQARQGGGGGENRTSSSTGAPTISSKGAPTTSPTGSARTSGGSSAMTAVGGNVHLGLTFVVAAALRAL